MRYVVGNQAIGCTNYPSAAASRVKVESTKVLRTTLTVPRMSSNTRSAHAYNALEQDYSMDFLLARVQE
jgi:hypothetical protein